MTALSSESLDVAAFRRATRQLVDRVIAPAAAHADTTSEPPIASYQRAVELGIAGLTIPIEYGGSAASQVAVSAAIEELARGCASTAMMIAAPIVVGDLVSRNGSESVKRRYLPDIADGTSLPAMAITESDAGSDIRAMRTVARRTEGGGLVVNGRKLYITNGGIADMFVVFTKEGDIDSRDISAFVVDAATPGLSVGPPLRKLGLHGSSTTEVVFDDMPVGEHQRLGTKGDAARFAKGVLDRARINTAAQAHGIACSAMEHVISFVRTRRQFGRSIAEFQAIQIRVAEMHIRLAASAALLFDASSQFDLLGESEARATVSSVAKVFCSDTASYICNEAVVLLGGLGYMKEAVVERLLRDCKGTQIYDGTNDINRTTIARNVLSGSE